MKIVSAGSAFCAEKKNRRAHENGQQAADKMLSIINLTPVRMAIVKKTRDNGWLARMWRKGNTYTPLVGMQIGPATVANSVKFPQKHKNISAIPSSNPISH